MKAVEFEPAMLKALFKQLVAAIGTQDACATYLGISRQRVAQLLSLSEDHASDIPTWGQVFTLEAALERSVVFAGLAKMIQGEPEVDLMATSISSTVASATSMQAVVEMEADGREEEHELKRAEDAARDAFLKAQDHYNAVRARKAQIRLVS